MKERKIEKRKEKGKDSFVYFDSRCIVQEIEKNILVYRSPRRKMRLKKDAEKGKEKKAKLTKNEKERERKN